MPPATGARAVPGTPGAYFALLVGAVLATGVLIFFSLDLSLPGRMDAVQSRLTVCTTAFDAAAAALEAQGEADDGQQRHALAAEYRSCLRPAFARPMAVAAGGLGLLIVVALALYLAQPWWLVRRNRARRLSPDLAPGLIDDLEQLHREVGLARAPQWWVAPLRGTPSGQVFGLPGRRRVQLDAGLLVLRVTDRAAFRAVVAHELAHLRNRDVDLTYLTIAVWRAFLLVAVLPVLALLVHPTLLTAPARWRPAALSDELHLLVLLLGPILLVYLLRNAVLRTRETHADVLAASAGDAGRALPAILERLPPRRRWLDRWSDHPLPRDRLRAVHEPAALVIPAHWEMVAAGLPTGVLAANLLPVAGGGLGVDPVLGAALVGLLAGPWLGALLALAVWRVAWATSAGAARSGPVPAWLSYALVLVGSFLLGTQVALVTVTDGPVPVGGSDPASTLVAGLLLAVAAVGLSAWADSTARAAWTRTTRADTPDGATSPPRPRHRALRATLVAAGLAAGTVLAVWLPFSAVRFGFALAWGPAPATGDGWYAALGMVSTADLGPAYRFVHNPLTLPTLTVLWLVPAALAWHSARWRALWHAVLVGLGSGAVAAVIGALLPLAARATIPEQVRQAVPQPDEISFGAVLDNATIAVGSVLVALAMTVVVAGRGPLRPPLALLAATVSTVVSAAAVWWVAGPVRCQTGVGLCREAVDVGGLARTAHWTLVQGLLVAVPLVLATALLSHRRREPADAPAPPGRRAVVATTAGLAVLLAAVAVLTWGVGTSAYETWLRGTFG
ncbi:M48 family metalloprotease [Micromonospora sp. WMMD812]|uniref:M48 family metalloprotease n=1 Tax=Micromonospora sp. WMMD812 TaxID=3015152 RepID=UPI00248B4CCD|nr:M48 family metalloprotease [Micromonospora sp. WMMD812]WBB68408.1 M48 family metalloprotease [Micromonospora sp. WMMD812]